MAGQHLDRGLLQHPVGQRHQVWLEHTERLARVGGAGEGPDLDLGVREQQPQHLTAGVPAGAGDRDALLLGHVHDHT